MDVPASSLLDVRLATLRVGAWLGWLSVVAVVAGLAFGLPAHHRAALIALIASAAGANMLLSRVPRSWWTTPRRGEEVLQIWSVGLVTLTSALVLVGGAGSDLDLLFFLVLPFLATAHAGSDRARWLALAFACFLATTLLAPDPLPGGQLALRACLLAAGTALAIVLSELNRAAAAGQAELRARADLEHALLAESHHRVKNSLQTVTDLLLLGKPGDTDSARAFDDTAARIQAIAAVHSLLADARGEHVDPAHLLELIARGHTSDARVRAIDIKLEPAVAQHLGVVANELIANAVRHGTAPIAVDLSGTSTLTLSVRDAGMPPTSLAPGLGLQLVERVSRDGLRGSFVLAESADGRTEARVTFNPA